MSTGFIRNSNNFLKAVVWLAPIADAHRLLKIALSDRKNSKSIAISHLQEAIDYRICARNLF